MNCPRLIVALLALTFIVGCSGPADDDSSDGPPIGADFVINQLVDCDDEQFKKLFVTPPSDEEIKAYRDYFYYAAPKGVKGRGSEADVTVEVESDSGESITTVTWKMKKVDGDWKILDAPLP